MHSIILHGVMCYFISVESTENGAKKKFVGLLNFFYDEIESCKCCSKLLYKKFRHTSLKLLSYSVYL